MRKLRSDPLRSQGGLFKLWGKIQEKSVFAFPLKHPKAGFLLLYFIDASNMTQKSECFFNYPYDRIL